MNRAARYERRMWPRGDRLAAQVPADVVGECVDRGITLAGIFPKGLGHDRFEVAAERAPQFRRRGGALRRAVRDQLWIDT